MGSKWKATERGARGTGLGGTGPQRRQHRLRVAVALRGPELGGVVRGQLGQERGGVDRPAPERRLGRHVLPLDRFDGDARRRRCELPRRFAGRDGVAAVTRRLATAHVEHGVTRALGTELCDLAQRLAVADEQKAARHQRRDEPFDHALSRIGREVDEHVAAPHDIEAAPELRVDQICSLERDQRGDV